VLAPRPASLAASIAANAAHQAPKVENAGLNDGGPRITPHDSRHAVASRLAARGLSSSDVAAALGHEKASTAEST
jgi:integrase